ncbi:hypothetical protein HD596_007901 [Nonomuraea jabiensis]|uniref:Uncharacterized protein n=1 Tax=Nonomuraea jabiensis TaxID=882448 RepID=A0A7W9GC98_9ACTN|nr:hypothetical protein [Nonomuraea jabiensis]
MPTSLTYEQAPQEALCYGWIDGMARRRDESTYCPKAASRHRLTAGGHRRGRWPAIRFRRPWKSSPSRCYRRPACRTCSPCRASRAGWRAETVTMSSAGSKVVAVLEDYAGNKATTVLRGN